MIKKGFTLIELIVVMAILAIITLVGLGSYQSTQQKARDSRRKSDLKQIAGALEFYYNDYGQYPAHSGDGRITGCYYSGLLRACNWGDTDPTHNFKDVNGTMYMVYVPTDPKSGYQYYYRATASNGKWVSYQLYSTLENAQDPDYKAWDSFSGTIYCQPSYSNQCHYGVSSPNKTP